MSPARDLRCALLSALVAQHRYGQPIAQDELLRIASYQSHRGSEAKHAFDALRREPFIIEQGKRGIMLDNGAFGQLAQYLYDECGWEELELRVRLKHFEGWDDLEFG